MQTTSELKAIRTGTVEAGMAQARQLLGKRIEIPVHYDMWMRGARFGQVTAIRQGWRLCLCEA